MEVKSSVFVKVILENCSKTYDEKNMITHLLGIFILVVQLRNKEIEDFLIYWNRVKIPPYIILP